MDHDILLESDLPLPEGAAARLEEAVRGALAAEKVSVPCEINLLVTDDRGIHRLNLETRGVDRATDVLSFPMFELEPGVPPAGEEYLDPATGRCPLGDICISLERARVQGEEYGHGLERELCYLAVHSVLHLLGYDHMDEGEEKRRMRQREEAILSQLGLERS